MFKTEGTARAKGHEGTQGIPVGVLAEKKLTERAAEEVKVHPEDNTEAAAGFRGYRDLFPLLLPYCHQVSRVHSRFSSPVTHCHGQGRYCCWRWNRCQHVNTRGVKTTLIH